MPSAASCTASRLNSAVVTIRPRSLATPPRHTAPTRQQQHIAARHDAERVGPARQSRQGISAGTCPLPPSTRVTRSNRAVRHWAARHVRHWADSADRVRHGYRQRNHLQPMRTTRPRARSRAPSPDQQQSASRCAPQLSPGLIQACSRHRQDGRTPVMTAAPDQMARLQRRKRSGRAADHRASNGSWAARLARDRISASASGWT